jgi:hypothetical protein
MSKKVSNKIDLQLGDVIEISKDNDIQKHIYYIFYLDEKKVVLVDTLTLEKIELPIHTKDNTLGDEHITNILILGRREYPGYARQNGLVPGTWIDIHIGGDVPQLITGLITNIEEDTVEVKQYKTEEVFYLPFEYKGLPERIPIQEIVIREKPKEDQTLLQEPIVIEESIKELKPVSEEENKEREEEEAEQQIQAQKEEEKESGEEQKIQTHSLQIINQIKEFILEGNEIVFGDSLGYIQQVVAVDEKYRKYDIEVQLNDLMDDLLSTIPTRQRTPNKLNEVHQMVERFAQLRKMFSSYDEYGNVSGPILFQKPLLEYFEKFHMKLSWIFPVTSIIKKVYDLSNSELETIQDINILVQETVDKEIETIQKLFKNTKNSSLYESDNKYIRYIQSLQPYGIPFLNIDPENRLERNIIHDSFINTNIETFLNNLDNFNSSVSRSTDIGLGEYDIEIIENKFVRQTYVIGSTGLKREVGRGSTDIHSQLFPITSSEKMDIHSYLFLQDPVMLFSRISLPNTYLYEKANLSFYPLQVSRLFKPNYTNVNNFFINDVNTDIEWKKNAFAKHPTQMILSSNKSSDYKKYLETIIPEDSTWFSLMNKYIKRGKISVLNSLAILEPFLLYTHNVSYSTYQEIEKFNSGRLKEFYSLFAQNKETFSKIFDLYKKTREIVPHPLLHQILSKKNPITQSNIREEILDSYHMEKESLFRYSNSEILRKIILRDYGNLYYSAVSIENIHLMIPKSITNIYSAYEEQKEEQSNGSVKEDRYCKKVVIAKLYSTEQELRADNDKEIYFDKKFDKTNYAYLDDFEKELVSMSPESFIQFLQEKVKKELKLGQEDSSYLAETLLNGYKKVLNGQYAMLLSDKNDHEFYYYIRKNKKWVLDESFDPNILTDDQNVFCNIEEKCVAPSLKIDSSESQKCIPNQQNKFQLQEELLKKIIDEFDDKYEFSIDQMKMNLASKYEYYLRVLPSLNRLEMEQKLKYNLQKYKLGLLYNETEETIIVSPYQKLLNTIMSQTDFIKKQHDIIRFKNMFTRNPIDHQESPHYLYCPKTSVKLLPLFMYQMAVSFTTMKTQDYNLFVQTIIRKIGVISDDGDKWVSQYGGEFITNIDFNIDEGYNDEGFKEISREVLENDELEMEMELGKMDDGEGEGQREEQQEVKKKIRYTDPTDKKIVNIVNIYGSNMGINLESQQQFVLSTVHKVLDKKVLKREVYEKLPKEKTKNKQYDDYTNEFLLYYTIASILIAIQTSIPELKTKRTFPGCKRGPTLEDYPFHSEGKEETLYYMACIAYEIRTGDYPWKVLQRKKQDFIREELKKAIENLIKTDEIIHKMGEKAQYIMRNPKEALERVPSEYDVTRWTGFLPPLFPIQIKKLENISSEFRESLKTNVSQEKILIIQSKIILFSLQIQQKINAIVLKESLLMKKQNGELYLDNSCCNERNPSVHTAIQYFENKDHTIRQTNIIVSNLDSILSMIQSKTEANTLYCNISTKNIYPPISNEYSEETIYYAFIQFCHFKSLKPIHPDLLPVCKRKPETVKETDNLITIIGKLKTERIEYSADNFLELLKLVHRKNKVPMDISDELEFKKGKEHRFIDLLNYLENEKKTVKEKVFAEGMKKLQSKKSGTETREEAKEYIVNYLLSENENMKSELINVIQSTQEEDAKTKRESILILNELGVWEKQDHSIIYAFFQKYIQNFVHVFPNIITSTNSVSPVIPTYIGLSERDKKKMEDIIREQFNSLEPFFIQPTLVNILRDIPNKTNTYYSLSKETPAFDPLQLDNQKIDIGTNLYEYYLLRVLTNYLTSIQDTKIIDKPDRVDARENVGRLFIAYLQIMQKEKEKVDISYQHVADDIFKIQQFEKKKITDRLKGKNDEARQVDNVKKAHKLDEWGIGLKKGFGKYDGKNYDQNNELADELDHYEALIEQLRVNKNGVTVEEQDELDYARENLEADIDNYNFDNTRQFRQNPNDEDDGDIDYELGDDTDYDME